MGLLDGLKTVHRELLTHGREVIAYPPGSILYRTGDSASQVYSVASGEVLLKATKPDGTHLELTYGPGDLFGLAALIPGGQTRLAEASTPNGATLIEFGVNGAAALKQHFGAEPATTFTRNVLAATCKQILHIRSSGGADVRLKTTRHPDYPPDTSRWISTVEASLPSGFLGGLFTKKKYAAGTVILPQGKVPDGFFFLKEGTVAGGQEEGGGTDELVAPTVFGHLAYFAGVPQTVSRAAVTDCQIVPFDAKSLDSFIKKNPEEGYELLNAILLLSVFQYLEIESRR